MGNFFENLWSAISLLAWSDWLTLIILIVFVVRGFIQGLAKEVISFIFVLIAIVVAWLYYETFAKTFLSNWISADSQSAYALSFGGIFLSIWLFKKGLYRVASASSSAQSANELNRPFANIIITLIVAVISYNFLGVFSDPDMLEPLISNQSFRNFMSFVLLFAILMIALVALSKLLNIKVDSENPSPLSPAYEGILRVLSALDVLKRFYGWVGKSRVDIALVGIKSLGSLLSTIKTKARCQKNRSRVLLLVRGFLPFAY